MKTLISILLLCVLTFRTGHAQGIETLPDFSVVEDNMPYDDDSEYSTEELEELYSDLLLSPVDINDVSPETLMQFPFLSTAQIDSLQSYIDRNGPLLSVNELMLVGGFDWRTCAMLRPFVCAGGNANAGVKAATLADRFKYGRSELTVTGGYSFPKRKGYASAPDSAKRQAPGSYFLGGPLYNSVKYRYGYKDNMSIGVVAEKDAGEPFFKGRNKYGYDFYSYGWGDMRKHYYRNAYLDCVRAVDFVKSRDKVDQDAIFAAGGSQGGCFTYVAAGLTQAFRAIAPSITGHADFTDGMRIVNWPRQKFLDAQEALGWTDEERDAFNSYFDTMNFAKWVTCPVITSFSLQDTTDPAHTNIAPYNLLQNAEKADNRYIINPFLGHGTPGDWTQTYMDFFENYVGTKIPTGINEVETEAQNAADGQAYNIAGMRVGDDYKGIVIVNGRKYIRK